MTTTDDRGTADGKLTLAEVLESFSSGRLPLKFEAYDGSSTGPEDHAPGLVAELGELLAHGVALRPASPTGVGFVGGVPVLLLPGNPVSCLCAYDLFGGRVVRRLGGRPVQWPYRSVERPLLHKLVSAVGRVDYVRVKLTEDTVEPLAVSGASIGVCSTTSSTCPAAPAVTNTPSGSGCARCVRTVRLAMSS